MRSGAARGSALLVALVLLAALSLLALSLVFTTSLTRSGADPQKVRGLLSAEGAIVLAAALVEAPEAGGARLFRDAALPLALSGSGAPAPGGTSAASFEGAVRSLAPPAELEPVAFAGVSADDGSDLKSGTQSSFAAETYQLRARVPGRGGAARGVDALVWVPAVPLDVRRLPEPAGP